MRCCTAGIPVLASRITPCRGLTILECLLATVVLVIAVSSLVLVLAAGRTRFTYSENSLHAVRVGEQLIEEIAPRPYFGAGSSRSSWCLSDYDGYTDGPGLLVDAWGASAAPGITGFRRSVTVVAGSVTVPDLGAFTSNGKTVTVTVAGPDGDVCELVRFITEPSP